MLVYQDETFFQLETNLYIEGVRHELGQIPSESLRSAGLCGE